MFGQLKSLFLFLRLFDVPLTGSTFTCFCIFFVLLRTLFVHTPQPTLFFVPLTPPSLFGELHTPTLPTNRGGTTSLKS